MNFDNLHNIFGNAWGIFLVVLFFGGSIFIHELGHFLAARKRGLKIERFSIGFGPRLFGWTGKDGVDYRVSLLPLGGYVALPQMVDMEAIEGKNGADADSLPPISYADKMIVAVMGVVFNILFAFAISCVLWVTGRPVPPNSITTTIGYVVPVLDEHINQPGPAYAAGLRPGDKILTVDGEAVKDFSRIMQKISIGSGRDARGKEQCTIKVSRDGKELEPFIIKPVILDLNPSSGDAIRRIGISPADTIIIEKPEPGSPAEAAGLKRGDEILALNGTTVFSFEHFKKALETVGEKESRLTVRSAEGETHEVTLTPVMLARKVELAQISFKDKETLRRLHLVPVPDNLRKPEPGQDKPDPERRNLMIFDTLPVGSQYASTLRPGAILASVDSVIVRTPADLAAAAHSAKDSKALLSFKEKRDADGELVTLEEFSATVLPAKKTPFIGITNSIAPAELVHQTPFEQIGSAFSLTFESLGKLVDRNSNVGINHLMGVISIAKTYYNTSDDIKRVLWFTLIININLAILNILPFPVLDGGHMLFATIQKTLGRPIPLKILTSVQYVFVMLFMGLMGYVLLNDVKRCSGDNTIELQRYLVSHYVEAPLKFQ
ncbi:MAG: RIP metalloprotease RseP [Puniceicoccales bacterium]|jgi:RIP metalloprotease RseP|nr:RIP metalloprotease RseP [Puniceicoccales bacterium]